MGRRICGIDEAGRGPLAGPIVAAGVVIPEDLEVDARDSKKVTERQRELWVDRFRLWAADHHIDYAYEIISVEEINAKGIGWANREVMRRLVLRLDADYYIVDGNHRLEDLGDKTDHTESIIRADERYPVVAAASILAKTYRDQIMRELHEKFPHYHWDKNKGYGTGQHISAIKTFGGTPFHRGQFVDTVANKEYKNKDHTAFAQPLLLLGPGTLMILLGFGKLFQNVFQIIG